VSLNAGKHRIRAAVEKWGINSQLFVQTPRKYRIKDSWPCYRMGASQQTGAKFDDRAHTNHSGDVSRWTMHDQVWDVCEYDNRAAKVNDRFIFCRILE
jgi:hypothetical protein